MKHNPQKLLASLFLTAAVLLTAAIPVSAKKETASPTCFIALTENALNINVNGVKHTYNVNSDGFQAGFYRYKPTNAICIRFTDTSGRSRAIALGRDVQPAVSGSFERITLNKSLGGAGFYLKSDAKVETFTIHSSGPVHIFGKADKAAVYGAAQLSLHGDAAVQKLSLLNPKSSLNVAEGSRVNNVTRVPGAFIGRGGGSIGKVSSTAAESGSGSSDRDSKEDSSASDRGNNSSSGSNGSSSQNTSRPFPKPIVKTVTIGAQKGSLSAGTPGSVSFDVTAENIADDVQPVVNWEGGAEPNGVSAAITKVSSNKATVTIVSDAAANLGNYRFTVTADGVTSGAATLTIGAPVPVKTVTVGAQKGSLSAGTAGSVTFDVTAENIADGEDLVVNWEGGAKPQGISTSAVLILSNKAIVTVIGDASTNPGNYNFTVTADGVTSGAATLTIGAPIPVKSVTIGAQKGSLSAGTAGTVSFDVTTENIADGVQPVFNWEDGAGPKGIIATATKILLNKATVTIVSDKSTSTGNYNFTVTADGVTSGAATLTIGAPVPVKTVTVGAQQGSLSAGTLGSVSFDVTTENIADDVQPVINWDGGAEPNGVSAAITKVSSNKATITVSSNNANIGNYNFTVTADGVTSGAATLTIVAPVTVRTVTVGAQKGSLPAGTVGSVTFDVTTVNIADNVETVIRWTDGAGPKGITATTTKITSNKATVTIVSDTSTNPGNYNFTVTADGITSGAATLTIGAPNPVKTTVTVGAQQGSLSAGTAGTVSFDVITENIADGEELVVKWKDDAQPQGISISAILIFSNKAIVTIIGNTYTNPGNYNFTVTAGGITSGAATLTIGAAPDPIKKTVTIGAQKGSLSAGTAGSVTFDVTTVNIADGEDLVVNWEGGAKPQGISTSTVLILSNKATVTVIGKASTNAGNYNFTVTSDGVTSANPATLVINS